MRIYCRRWLKVIRITALSVIGFISISAVADDPGPPPPAPPSSSPPITEDSAAQEVMVGNQMQSTVATIVSQNTQYRIKKGPKGVTITNSVGRSVFIPAKEVKELLRSHKK